MLAQTPPENPLLEIAKSFDKDSIFHKDISKLSDQVEKLTNVVELLEIETLVTILEHRAGGSKSKGGEKPIVEKAGGFIPKVDEFMSDFVDELLKPFKGAKDSIAAKSEMPAQIEKIKIEDKEEPEKVLPVSDNTNTNKVLSDMVEVLIDMRDDKSQKQLVQETIEIKKLIESQGKKPELSGGIEPNIEESKFEEREKLADSIAKKLGEVLEESGIGSNSNLGIPDLPDKKRKPGGKVPTKMKSPTGGTKAPTGMGKAAIFGGELLSGAGLLLGAYEASEYLDETGYGDKMAEGAGKDAEQAFKNINPDFSHLDITPQQAQDILDQPDSPGKQRDLESFGGEEELRKKAALLPKFEQASLRKYDYNPETSPKIEPIKVEPKPVESSVSKMLNQVSDTNTELKMFNMPSSETQMLAPIISNKTINNTEQTMIANAPTPHSSANSFNKWQLKRSNYID